MAASRADRNEFRLRTFSSVGVVLVILGGIHFGGYVWAAVAVAIALSSLGEYYRIVNRYVGSKRKGARISPGVGYIISLVFLLAALSGNAQPIILAMILSLCVCGVFVVEIFRRQFTGGESYAVQNAGAVISGVIIGTSIK